MNIQKKLMLMARLAPVTALLSCAAPKAEIVEEAPVSKTEKVAEVATAPETPADALPDDGIRLPDMLGLPGENELRSTRPATTGGGSGAVIARPPVETKSPP